MFRRLFISLLILSALTSDGTVNIAGYLIDLYQYDGIDPDLIILEGNMPEEVALEDTGGSDLLYPGACCITYSDSSEDDEKTKYSFVLFSSEYDYNAFLYIPSIQWMEANSLYFCVDEDISLYMSDLSPPCV
ncbi:hypothetical protein [Acetivibrio straminisolvens]|jgi:hypothetical protein|uniref:Uncharacterized protein n=1 Tax=Acetivibrio straminisolvens JCM 21531 TaxID=1294263 RepID=W4V0U4_9FIRM|nr:hypothetical protein [Acetivibrio straminisolvens]GAE87110.1 hypothetical protein JCM21531_455 [Acetivibrio straminisolvens JCM 21531]